MARNDQQGFNDRGRFTGQHGGSYRYHEPDRYYRADRDRNAYGREHSDGDRDDGHFSGREWDRQNRGGPFWSSDKDGEQRARWMHGPSERTFKNEGDWDAGKASRARRGQDFPDDASYGQQPRYTQSRYSQSRYDEDRGYGPTTGGGFGQGSMDDGRFVYGNRNRQYRDQDDDRSWTERNSASENSRGLYRSGDDDYRYSRSSGYGESGGHERFGGYADRDSGYRSSGRSGSGQYRNTDEEDQYLRWRDDQARHSDHYRDVF